jgi:general secretion pathway protein J
MIASRRGGFTLIELLIALAILALVATLGYRALASLTDSEAKLAAEGVHWRNLDALFARLEADARGALPRDVRTDAGTEPAWIGRIDGAGDAEMRFSRAGSEFTLESGSGGQRIGYRLRNGAIEVLYWPYLDQPASVRPQAYALMGNVTRFRVAYLDARGAWRDRWPALGESAIPRAIRVALTLSGGEVIERWLALR